MLVLKKAKKMLEKEYNISHATISVEDADDEDGKDMDGHACGQNIHERQGEKIAPQGRVRY